MVYEFTIITDRVRPVVALGNDSDYALFDSGAKLPVWVSTPKVLADTFPDYKLCEGVVTFISGFGGNDVEPANVVILPSVTFKGIPVTIHDLRVVVFKDPTQFKGSDFSLVLPVNIFKESTLLIENSVDSYISGVSVQCFGSPEYYCITKDKDKLYTSKRGKSYKVMDAIKCLSQAEYEALCNN